MNFDDDQIKVIEAEPVPQLVIAGPGSGKTAVLTHRIRYLNEHFKIPLDKILVITFTRAAALQMKSRFSDLCKDSKVTFCTFHALFYSMINDFESQKFSVITHKEKLNIIKRVLLDLGIKEKDIDIQKFIDELSFLKNSDLNPEEFNPTSVRKDRFPLIYDKYIRESYEEGLMDYDDFSEILTKIFKDNPDFLQKKKSEYDYCIIDEFQDINMKQYEIVKLLFKDKPVFAVGDEDQSIYAFRGSKSEICYRFIDDFNAKLMKLETNYRCDKDIVSASVKLISKNKDRFKKKIVSKKDAEKGIFDIKNFRSKSEEYEYVARKLSESYHTGRSSAILLRTNNLSDIMIYMLNKYHISFYTDMSLNKGKGNECIKDFIAYLKLSMGDHTYKDLLRIANKPNRYISSGYLAQCKAADCQNAKSDDLFKFRTLYRECKDKTYLKGNIFKLEKHIKELSKLGAFESIVYIMNVIDYNSYLVSKQINFEDEYKELKMSALEFDTKEELISYLEASEGDFVKKDSKGEYDTEICTIHSAKGREWDDVFVCDVNENNIPHKKAVEDKEIEEERRLFYVAMTRAKKKLILTYVKDEFKNLKPSPFLYDISKFI